MNRKLFLLMAVSCLLACEDDKKVDEECDPKTGTVRGSKWCDGTTLTNDYHLYGDIRNKSRTCSPGAPTTLTDLEKEAMLKHAEGDASYWSLFYGVCFKRAGADNGPPYEPSLEILKPFVLEKMDARWSGDLTEYKRYYPNCEARFDLWPHPRPESEFVYRPTGCTPDDVTGGDPRIPSGAIVVTPFVHFEAFYPKVEFDKGTFGNLNLPNAIDAKTSMELTSRMLKGISINHDITVADKKQTLKLEAEAEFTEWKHRSLPATSYWSKDQSNRFNLESPYVVTALTTIIEGNGSNPTKILTQYMTKDSKDISGVFRDNKLFIMQQGEVEFINHHKVNLKSDWTAPEVRSSQIHFNLLYHDRLVTFLHLFVKQDFSGSNAKEVFCTCVGAACFEDLSYTTGCTIQGERKFVPEAEEAVYLEYALSRPDYDGTVPPQGGSTRSGSPVLKKMLPDILEHTVGFTSLMQGKENNSFYVFFDRRKWPIVLGSTPGLSEAKVLQQKAVAHEIGHHIFGASHATSRDHIMFRGVEISAAVPMLDVPFRNSESNLINSYNLTQGIWSQPQ